MYITSVDLLNFRNYERQTVELKSGVNLFYGNNAQGKTNFLEAVYIAGTSRSHKGSRDREMIRKGAEESHIRMDLMRGSVPHRIDLHLKKNSPKGIAVDRIPVHRASELFGIVQFVFFSPEDLMIIKSGPASRRRFINLELCQMDRLYLNALAGYTKCLAQRNRLLKEITDIKRQGTELDVWDMQLLRYGTEIIERRKEYLEELNAVIAPIHADLTGEKEKIFLQYEANVSAADFEKKLAESRERDLRFKETHTGPHRDDIAILLNGMDARIYGSQGQQRTAALSLKLSEIGILRKKTGDTPVLLLDDVLSELDENRQSRLLAGMKGVQTLITCTGLDDFVSRAFPADSVFYVENGNIS